MIEMATGSIICSIIYKQDFYSNFCLFYWCVYQKETIDCTEESKIITSFAHVEINLLLKYSGFDHIGLD